MMHICLKDEGTHFHALVVWRLGRMYKQVHASRGPAIASAFPGPNAW